MSQQPYPDPWAQGQPQDGWPQGPQQDPWGQGRQQGPQDAIPPGYQGVPQAPYNPAAYGYGFQPQMPVPQGMWFDQASGLMLPQGVQLATSGRRIGAYFLTFVLFICTLGIGFIIWELIAWGSGRGPAMQALGMRCWKPAEGRPATFGTMALRNLVGYLAQGILGALTVVVSFILFLTDDQHRSIPDRVGSTVVVYDPYRVLDSWQRY